MAKTFESCCTKHASTWNAQTRALILGLPQSRQGVPRGQQKQRVEASRSQMVTGIISSGNADTQFDVDDDGHSTDIIEGMVGTLPAKRCAGGDVAGGFGEDLGEN